MAKEILFSHFVSLLELSRQCSHTSVQSLQYLVGFRLQKNNCNIAAFAGLCALHAFQIQKWFMGFLSHSGGRCNT